MLAAIPQATDLRDADDDTLRRIDVLWDALTAIDGIGPASASKLLARKRPRPCPISDGVVIKAADVPGRTWEVLRCLLHSRIPPPGLRSKRSARPPPLRPACCASWMWACGCLTANRRRHGGCGRKRRWPHHHPSPIFFLTPACHARGR